MTTNQVRPQDCADCENCPLRVHWMREGCWQPVPIQHATDPDNSIVFVGDGPTKTAFAEGRAFSGQEGIYLLNEVKELGHQRKDFGWAYTVACRWPNDDPSAYLAKLRASNRKRVRQGQDPIQSPVTACAPYRKWALEDYPTVVPMGSLSTKVALGTNPSLEAVRGGPTRVGDVNVLPTYSPSMMGNKKGHLKEVLTSDISKAIRHHEDKLRWTDPKVIYVPTREQALDFFSRHKVLAYDVETDGVDCLTAGLRCVGIGAEDEVLIIPFDLIGGGSYMSPEDRAWFTELLAKVFTDKTITKVGHNAGYFDRLVVEQHFGVTPEPLVDTLLLHKLAASEHRHRLGFIGSVMTDVPAWKADHTGVLARTDQELYEYCATDVAVTARIRRPLEITAEDREQDHLYKTDAKLQDICAGMRRMGIRIDEGRRLAHHAKQTDEVHRWRSVIEGFSPGMNPNSNAQVRDLLFGRWKLPVLEFTDTGDESINAMVLRSLVGHPLVEDKHRKFINALRFYRRAHKLLSTYLNKLAPGAGFVRDGYVYPDYNSHGTVTGRLSSSNPNFQNIPFDLRDMFIPPPGCVFVGADYDQLELRFAAALAGEQHYLDAFEKKEIDPHNLTGDLMFGEKFWAAQGAPDTKMGKGKGAFKQLRNLAKTICFASLYGASAPKVYEIITRAEDEQGNMLYANYSLKQIRLLHKKWLANAPEFKNWWKRTLDSCRATGYIEEVVLGRRRYFADEDYNAILNFGVQAGGFAVVGLSMIELVERHLPFDFDRKHGLVNQLHDAVLFAVPEDKAEETRDVVTEVMTRSVPGLPVTFSAEAEIGTSWREV